MSYPLAAARESKLFDRIHISTEDAQIQRVAESLGFEIDFPRPLELAGDHTPLMPVVKWVTSRYRERGQEFETVCVLLPCAPLITAADLVVAHQSFERHAPRKPLMSVSRYPVPVEWAYSRAEDGSLTPVDPKALALRSQDLEVRYHDAGQFYFFDASHLAGDLADSNAEFASYVVPRSRSVDIDDEEDLAVASTLFRGAQRPPYMG